jgi:DNA replication protein DnaC
MKMMEQKKLNSSKIKRRELTQRDLERMRVPERFWHVDMDRVHEGKTKDVIIKYMRNMGDYTNAGEPMKNGYGLILWGHNDTGKTSVSVLIAKEARRRGFSVLFVRAVQYRDFVMQFEKYNESESLKHRCETVDLLILDDLGKESSSLKSKGGSERLFEDLLRERTSNLRSTIITMNSNPEKLEERYERSFQRMIIESFVQLKLVGESQRDIEKQKLVKFITS